MSDQESGEKQQGRLAKWGASVKKAAADAQAAAQERAAQNQEAYGNLVQKATFGTTTVEVYDGGYVRVATFMSGKTPFEKLRSIKYTHQVQDKSAGGRAAMGLMTGGLSYLGSKEKRIAFLTIATDRKVHTLQAEGGMMRTEDKTGMALEAAGQAVIQSPAQSAPAAAPAAPAQPDIADQIKKLADLHAAGVLTDEEFSAKKAELLDRM